MVYQILFLIYPVNRFRTYLMSYTMVLAYFRPGCFGSELKRYFDTGQYQRYVMSHIEMSLKFEYSEFSVENG